MQNNNSQVSRETISGKRVFDILFSFTILILLCPIYFILAILVKLSSRGPIVYRQERLGQNGKRFTILKFRTMPVDAEQSSGPVFADAGDKRATSFGNFLRKTSLDELPQFLNVLKGEMSVVGPRPERPFFVNQFRKEIPEYMRRHQLRPGLTGWAQINGWRGKTCIRKRLDHDLYYIETCSIYFDLKIILTTVYQEIILKVPNYAGYIMNLFQATTNDIGTQASHGMMENWGSGEPRRALLDSGAVSL